MKIILVRDAKKVKYTQQKSVFQLHSGQVLTWNFGQWLATLK